MAHHLSAKKAIRQTVTKTLINKSRASRIKTYIKKVLTAIKGGKKDDAKEAFIIAQSEIMKGVNKNVLKLNNASRKVSRLSKKVKNMQISS
jgi:small subunit ribosomal protein S20